MTTEHKVVRDWIAYRCLIAGVPVAVQEFATCVCVFADSFRMPPAEWAPSREQVREAMEDDKIPRKLNAWIDDAGMEAVLDILLPPASGEIQELDCSTEISDGN